MANKNFGLGILVMALVFGMTVVGCDNSGPTNENGGAFVLTDIPEEYNGKYAFFSQVFVTTDEPETVDESDEVGIIGCQGINTTTGIATLVRISNGKVNIPTWVINFSNNSVSKYSGNDLVAGGVSIWDSQTVSLFIDEQALVWIDFDAINFSNGIATKSAKDGEIITGL
jgi:hypothetical protein